MPGLGCAGGMARWRKLERKRQRARKLQAARKASKSECAAARGREKETGFGVLTSCLKGGDGCESELSTINGQMKKKLLLGITVVVAMVILVVVGHYVRSRIST